MTITQLRCFIAMAEELSFTHAAKKLYISQTAVTYHIKALEKELGTDLFVRTTRKVILSEVGKQFYRDVREAVQTIDTAYESVRKNNKKKTFSIGYSTLCYGKRFQKIVSRFAEEFSSLRIVLNNIELEDNLFDLILDGQLDVALFLNPFVTVPKGIKTCNLGKVRHMLMVPISHQLSKHNSINSNELPQQEILAHAGIKRMEQMESTMFGWVVEPRWMGDLVPKNLESLLSMVRAGFCLARLPALDEIEQEGIHCLTVVGKDGDLGPGPDLTVAWHSERASFQIERFRVIVEQEISSQNN